MKKIAVFHTGGTIAMRQDESGGVSTSDAGASYLAEVVSDVKLDEHDVFNIPSPHMTVAHMDTLRRSVLEVIEDGSYDGVVITHGTDTLEETAFFLDLTLPVAIPVVVTGAMRSANEVGADGPHNFGCAVRVAASGQARDAGVLVVMNEEIHAARNVTKTHTRNVAAFQSPQTGPLGSVTANGVHLRQHPRRAHQRFDLTGVTLPTGGGPGTEGAAGEDLHPRVALLKAYAGMDSFTLNAFAAAGIDGLVIEALGAGNLPPAMLPGLRGLLDQGVTVVLVSRCAAGFTEGVYGYDGGGKQLAELGAILSNGINGPKARLQLLVALAAGSSADVVRSSFAP